jgi:hypothetical protein
MDKTYEGLMQMIFATKKHVLIIKLNIEFKQMVNTIQFGRGGGVRVGGVKAGENKVSGVQVNKRYVRVKNIDDRCYFRKFSM